MLIIADEVWLILILCAKRVTLCVTCPTRAGGCIGEHTVWWEKGGAQL